MMLFSCRAAAALLALFVCAAAGHSPACAQTPAESALPEPVRAAMQAAHIPEQALAVLVLDAQGRTRLSLRADAPREPASTMKLVSTLSALELLGPAHRWSTRLLSTGRVQGEVLKGDLYLQGGGEPDLTTERLASLLRQLRQKGVRTLRGDLLLDRTLFSPARPDRGAPAFDTSPEAYYNLIPDALLVNGNLLGVRIESDAQQVRAHLLTPLKQVDIHSTLSLSSAPCSQWEEGLGAPQWHNGPGERLTLTLSGTFPRNCQASSFQNLLERNIFIGRMFAALWEELGGRFEGAVREGVTPLSAQVLAEHTSETLADILRITNKQSDNAMARLLPLSLGATARPSAGVAPGDSTWALGEARIRAWLNNHHIDDTGLVLENGSGLSRSERISAQQLAALLQAGQDSVFAPEFLSSLPIAGLDGTMKKRLTTSPARLLARIKTGTLRNVVAIAGYVRRPEGNWIVVANLQHEPARAGRAVLDALIEWVASEGENISALPKP